MKFLSTILVLSSAYTLINGKPATGTELINQINQVLLTSDKAGTISPISQPNYGRPMGPDLTPNKKGTESCTCLPSYLCTTNLTINGEPCTNGTCGSVSMRINDGSCPNDWVRCCTDGIDRSTSGNGMPSLSSMPERSDCPCIPYFQCENGTACTDGCGTIDMRINNGICLAPNVRCCKGVKGTVTHVAPPIPNQNGPDLTPGITAPSCPCIPPHQCENGTPCTDGCGAIDFKINDGTCPLPNVRCCKEAFNGTLTPVAPPIPNKNGPDLTPGMKAPSCPCIPPYQCENGTPCTDGCDAIDFKINDGTCPLPNVLCCKEVNNGTIYPAVTPTTQNQNRPNLNPADKMSTCPCISYFLCNNGTPCTDGCGIVDVRINDGTCKAPNVRCCKGGNNNNPVQNTLDLTPRDPLPFCPCIPHYTCFNGTPCTEGCGVIDMRMNHDSCKSPNVLCCKENITSLHQKNGPPSRNDVESKPTSSGTFKRKGCGVRNPNGIGFRIAGLKANLANFGEFPWMVAILWEDTDTPGIQGYYSEQTLIKYKCGGSLIHPQVVLTSTHCVVSKEKKFRIRAGEWDIKSMDETFPHQDRMVEKVITHPEYYSGGLYNDIALLILETPVNITGNVDTVCLPAQDEISGDIRCFTSGWGTNVFERNGEFETTLKKVQLPIVQRDRCQDQLRIVREQNDFILHESFLCAGGEMGKDACEGDGGSPLTCPFSNNPKRYYQAGIVSWGIGCGIENVPGLYANVARFRNWVDQQMIQLGYDTSYYTY